MAFTVTCGPDPGPLFPAGSAAEPGKSRSARNVKMRPAAEPSADVVA